ncbi:hypothetical protein ONA70_33615 [Micromonospora yasonensis]|uniref:hypothetical protein n=1 Tax=Micromonospora yasonensis TaxID=1128667 RepID=UPI00222EF033|nr:hypothetical protein [Micromonospora yasonensis]MCW3845017.1 hypothetical protein [Micromonospora yasonensis]
MTMGKHRGMEHPGRIVVVSADTGAGQDTAAAGLTRRLRDGAILRWLPRGHDALLGLVIHSRLPLSVLRTLLRWVWRRLRRAIPADIRAGREDADRHGPALVDSVGDAVAVVAALLQAAGGSR